MLFPFSLSMSPIIEVAAWTGGNECSPLHPPTPNAVAAEGRTLLSALATSGDGRRRSRLRLIGCLGLEKILFCMCVYN